jgi:hypothetical protein
MRWGRPSLHFVKNHPANRIGRDAVDVPLPMLSATFGSVSYVGRAAGVRSHTDTVELGSKQGVQTPLQLAQKRLLLVQQFLPFALEGAPIGDVLDAQQNGCLCIAFVEHLAGIRIERFPMWGNACSTS